ncbi:hypothetical protein E1A91_A01G176400v1 [Gossypium mustelinum]|uniref:Uncharacterized protein n=1 Tax=Gossypium mustelinum TaxID=34275 RepID=A0A5D3AKG0_GOSMU|nr:hypothetical protein E1A91_A01G176400v1 [Gossypium mustelinum]
MGYSVWVAQVIQEIKLWTKKPSIILYRDGAPIPHLPTTSHLKEAFSNLNTTPNK